MKKWIMAPYATVGFQNRKLYIGFGSIQFIEENAATAEKYLKILRLFKDAHTAEEANARLPEVKNVTDLVAHLIERNILIDVNSYRPTERFSRQSLFFNMSDMDADLAQAKLAGKKVAIIGCGGIGNQVSVHLATTGVGSFVLCDSDKIETSNLSRQILFTEKDVGLPKAETLARELAARISTVKVSVVSRFITSTKQLDFANDVDFLIVSADAADVVNVVNTYCVEQKVPYMNVGYVNDISVWGPLYIPEETGCYACQDIIANNGDDQETRELLREVNRGYQAPSIGPINMISSGLASLDILKFLAGHPEKAHTLNRRAGLWTHNLTLEYQNCSRNPECRVCGRAVMA